MSDTLVKLLDMDNGKWKVFPDRIPDGENKPLAIIANLGDYGIGKSFLSNLLLNFLQKGVDSFENDEQLLRDFPMETSIRSETTGIDVYKDYFHINGGKYIASLWDTEGPSNPAESQENANTVFGISVYFSSVVLFNIKEKFTTSNIDKIQVFLLNMRTSMNNSNEKAFQDLVIVIRDWNDESFGFCWAGGKDYLQHLLSQERTDGQLQDFFKDLQKSFRSVHVFLMPLPNREVMSKQCPVRTMADLDEPFKSSMLILAKQLVFDLLEPRTLLREPLTVVGLKEKLVGMESTLSVTGIKRPHTLASAMKQEHIRKAMDESLNDYQLKLKEKWGWLSEEETRNTRHKDLKQQFVDKFREAVSVSFIEETLVEACVKQLDVLIDERFRAYNDKALLVQNVMWIVGGVVIAGGAVAVIVCFPELLIAAGGRALIVPTVRQAILTAIVKLLPIMKEAALGVINGVRKLSDESSYSSVASLQAAACAGS